MTETGSLPQGQANTQTTGLAWLRTRSGQWVQAPADTWTAGATRNHRKATR
jgi:hypothetical protein